jgi:hypothetical protein
MPSLLQKTIAPIKNLDPNLLVLGRQSPDFATFARLTTPGAPGLHLPCSKESEILQRGVEALPEMSAFFTAEEQC